MIGEVKAKVVGNEQTCRNEELGIASGAVPGGMLLMLGVRSVATGPGRYKVVSYLNSILHGSASV